MTPLRIAFAKARDEGSLEPVFEPFLEANLHIVGALDGNGKPNIALKASPVEGRLCATVSEDRRWLQGIPASRILRITGNDLLHVLGHDKDIIIVYADGADILECEWVDIFRQALQ